MSAGGAGEPGGTGAPRRALAVHGHFYQPPREDPATGEIPEEPGAAPFHDWNQRIYAECYRPNAARRNFQRISFDVGPTLASWMAGFDPPTWREIVAQDAANVERFGIGNALAQPYHHTILPLAPRHDKVTQVAWGIADFVHRFGRRPEGLWLPETAADVESLEVLAEQGVAFTLLAPWQAAAASVDATRAYQVALPSGRSIAVLFFHRLVSARLSFDPAATANADAFLRRLVLPAFRAAEAEDEDSGRPQGRIEETPRERLILLASDGELYGHHQKFRDLFLDHLFDGASEDAGLQPTFPARWLAAHPPEERIGIHEDTSWSCHHGVLRWCGECPCTPGAGPWKSGLRQALDRLAEAIDRLYLEAASPWFEDPWEPRHRWVEVLLGQATPRALLAGLARRPPPVSVAGRLELLLRAQRERQRMFTSCAWFFDDFDRIEPRNAVAYAAQAVEHTRRATGVDLAPETAADLARVESRRTGLTADRVFAEHLLASAKV